MHEAFASFAQDVTAEVQAAGPPWLVDPLKQVGKSGVFLTARRSAPVLWLAGRCRLLPSRSRYR